MWLFGAFLAKMTLLTGVVCVVPSFAFQVTKHRGRAVRVVLEATLFVATIILFGIWLIGTSDVGRWIPYAIGLVLVLEVGSHLLDRNRLATLERLRSTNQLKSLESEAKVFDRMFRNEVALYVPVPISLVIGTVLGLMREWRPEATLVFSVTLTLIFGSAVLLYFLLVTSLRMSTALLKISDIPTSSATDEVREGRIQKIVRSLFFFLSAPQSERQADRKKRELDAAYTVADLRRMYLYDAVHNVILLVAFAGVALKLLGVGISAAWFLGLLIPLSLGLNQLPYMIGQKRLHNAILARYTGIEGAKMAAELKKYSPLFPKPDFLAAFFMTGTGGGVVFLLLEESVKHLLIGQS
jgi:hypothetical protein